MCCGIWYYDVCLLYITNCYNKILCVSNCVFPPISPCLYYTCLKDFLYLISISFFSSTNNTFWKWFNRQIYYFNFKYLLQYFVAVVAVVVVIMSAYITFWIVITIFRIFSMVIYLIHMTIWWRVYFLCLLFIFGSVHFLL